MNETVLVDTGFWIALFDPRDKDKENAIQKADYVDILNIILPWPILYETLRTRFVRRRDWMIRLDERLKRPNVVFIDDQPYREEAYSLCVDFSTQRDRPISMVDMLCRLLIEDPHVRVDYLLTTNASDFHDVCQLHRVEIL